MLPQVTSHQWPTTAAPSDVATLDDLIKSMYDVISGPAGVDRDWARFESLYAPGGRMTRVVTSSSGDVTIESLTPGQYRASRSQFFVESGFYEIEIARRVVLYGSIAHAWSTYEGRLTPDGPTILRGANSIQAIQDNNRWWLLSVLWEHESAHKKLPDELL